MDQQDQVNQEIMDVDPIMLESIDEIEAFLELSKSIESTLTNVPENENVNAEEGEVTGTSDATMLSHIMEGCDDFEIKVNEKGALMVRFKKQINGKYQCMAKVGEETR